MGCLSKIATAGLQLTLLAQFALAAPASTGPELGAVASESAVCSRIGTDLLEAGGSAGDALVGTVFCVGVIGMFHSGIAGGGFALVRSSEGEYEFIDFRETAPAAAFEDMYTNNTDASLYGGLASGVPGELRGLEHIHNKYGVLPWADVMAPAIKVAREGFVVTGDLMDAIDSVSDDDFLTSDPNWAEDFAPNGELVKLGDTMTRKRYADTLQTIANEGPDAFYTGSIADSTIAALTASGGTMTLEDLKNYTVAIREPAVITYRGHKVTSCSAPSGGVVALSALKVMDGYDGFDDPAAINLTTHRMDEALRWAYGLRTELGDPSFVDGLDAYQQDMVSDATAAEIRSKISDTRTQNISWYDPTGLESLETPGTSHVVAADASGLALTLTTTINLIFGSRVIVPETGVILNDEMNDFSIPGASNAFGYIPSPANYVRPGKRPLSSISPTIVETPEGGLYYATGAAGGSRIITTTMQSVRGILDLGLDPAGALAAPRLHDQLVPDTTTLEWTYDNATAAFLASLGHNITWAEPGQSFAQALRLLPNGTFEAAGEPRQVASGGFAV
ncbi:hypothetical protein SLS62_004938 [Diatrype stigma]|uniref:Glutathione hydrolase n=1 Tax=Diatrype stigma TaxID=117547 RepID=A0AAN9YST9_9PEZI